MRAGFHVLNAPEEVLIGVPRASLCEEGRVEWAPRETSATGRLKLDHLPKDEVGRGE